MTNKEALAITAGQEVDAAEPGAGDHGYSWAQILAVGPAFPMFLFGNDEGEMGQEGSQAGQR